MCPERGLLLAAVPAIVAALTHPPATAKPAASIEDVPICPVDVLGTAAWVWIQAGTAAWVRMQVGTAAWARMQAGTVVWAQTQGQQRSLANQDIVRALGPIIIISHVTLHSPELLYPLPARCTITELKKKKVKK